MESKRRSIVGVVTDISRVDAYFNIKCSVFGIDEEEHACIKKHGVDIFPRNFTHEADKFLANTNAWKVMRVLGLFGYNLTHMPRELGKIKDAQTGERNTIFYTLESTTRWK
jgi:hypothetical protein